MLSAKCVTNSVEGLTQKQRKFAFTQNEEGLLDLTTGKEYAIYGLRKNKLGNFLLVLTDTIHTTTPWWMPANLFSEIKGTQPTNWITKSRGFIRRDEITASSFYLNAIEEVEDGDPEGIAAFEKMKLEN